MKNVSITQADVRHAVESQMEQIVWKCLSQQLSNDRVLFQVLVCRYIHSETVKAFELEYVLDCI